MGVEVGGPLEKGEVGQVAACCVNFLLVSPHQLEQEEGAGDEKKYPTEAASLTTRGESGGSKVKATVYQYIVSARLHHSM